MSNCNLASLPPFMLYKILSKVATSHLRDFGSARIAFSGLRCYQAGNLEAIYIRGHWGYEKPEVFMSLLERINPNVSHDCWCSAVIEPVFVVSLDGSRTRWTCNSCFWQCAA
ncbi:BnaC09g37920D [Brassica napus]|uniref:BnaC09g37920D protein n=1 Tax=Brassica napus TaxID=3708 RepID=A0A078HBS6_BRANA|nr:BnaC09g37920D [Brassica napus]